MAQLKSTLITGTLDVTGAISQKGIALSNTYLGKTDTATNSAKLNNQDPSYYLAWANITDKPTNLVTTNSNGKIPESYLPSYVDDVIEGYYYNSKFYKESSHTTVITAESGKIYIDLATNKTYRWSGSAYAEISASLALGETSSTAYAGDKGKANATNIAALQTTINNALPLNAGNNVKFTSENGGITISAEGSVKKVNNQEPDNNGNVSITLDDISDGSTRKLANYLPLSGGTMTGNLTFSPVSSTSYPASSNYISWSGSTDGAAIYYRVDASDKGRLVFQTADDSDCNFVWHNTVSGNGDVMTLTGNGNLTVKGDITSKGNKVALDKDVVKLTGDQSINGHKSFTFLSAEYLNGGVINTHPEASGAPAILGYYTNDLVNLHQKGGSCYIKNLTTGAIISESTPYSLFDASPTYYAFSAAQTDVVEIIIKSPVVYNWVTRGGIGFGNTQWGAKDIKIEVGYSPTGTGTAKNPDTDITWATKFNATNNWNEIIFTDLTGPDQTNGGTNSNSWNYLKFTLTNFRHATIRRIAQIFTFNSGSSGLLQTFLSSAGGTLYGGITPYRTNAYYLGTSDKKWAKLYSNDIYGGYIKSDRYLEGVLRSNTGGRVAKLNDIPHYNNDNNAANGKMALRLDLAWADVGNKPSGEGFIYTNMWDSANFDTQLFIPNGPNMVNGVRPSLRGCNNGTWQTTWKELAYYSDLDNYTKKSIKLWDNADLNTVTSSGFYRLMNMSSNTIFSHGQMIVCRGEDTIAQMVFPYDATRMYVRTGNPLSGNGSGAWRDWKQVAFTDNINNPKITIKQGGTEKGSFTLNQSGGTTIELTDNNTTYSAGTGLSLNTTNNTFSVKTGYTTDANNRNYKVAADSSGNLYVNVPWSSSGTLDTSLSSTSTNALQNKAIYSAFSSAVGYDNNYYAYGATGSWRIRQYNATGNSLDIRYGVIAINSQSTNYSVSFGNGKNFTSTNYIVVFGLYRSNAQSWFWSPIVQSKTESGFTVFLRGNSSGDNSGTIMYLAIRSN